MYIHIIALPQDNTVHILTYFIVDLFCFCFYHCHTLYMILYPIYPIYYNRNKKSKSLVMHGNPLRNGGGMTVS